jgi:hypothetical protein
MARPTTATRRLSNFMQSIASKMNNSDSVSMVLATEMGIDRKDTISIHRAYISILELFNEVIEESQTIEDEAQRKLLLEPVQELQNRFQVLTISAAANQFSVVEPLLTKLKYAAEFINTNVESSIDDNTLNELLKSADEMVIEIVNSDLPKYVRSRLVEILEKFRFALITYKLHGASGLRKAWEEIAGTIITNQGDIKDSIPKDSNNHKTITNLFSFIQKSGMIIEVALKTKQLVEPVVRWLLPSGQP